MSHFYDKYHQQYYEQFLDLDRTYPNDYERKALFYLLSLLPDTRTHINNLYDFEDHSIKVDGLNHAFQTGGSTALTLFAFNLYNGYEMREPLEVSESDLYIIVQKYNPDYKDYDYTYSDQNDKRLMFNHKMYTNIMKPANMLMLFSRIDKEFIPFIHKAIDIRFNIIKEL